LTFPKAAAYSQRQQKTQRSISRTFLQISSLQSWQKTAYKWDRREPTLDVPLGTAAAGLRKANEGQVGVLPCSNWGAKLQYVWQTACGVVDAQLGRGASIDNLRKLAFAVFAVFFGMVWSSRQKKRSRQQKQLI